MAQKKNLIEHFDTKTGTLELSMTSIQEIPLRDIVAIPKATSLDLSNNNIISFPKSFASSLTRLVKLDVSKNQLTSLPDDFGLLNNLKHLDLYSNKIQSLPLSFGNLKSLRWLDLKENPLMPKLAQIAGDCLNEKECQAAAKNVVAALRTMQEHVNEEINRRKEKQQKKLEKEEEDARNQIKENQQPKKKKKKTAKNGSYATQANGQSLSNSESENKNSSIEENGDLLSVSDKKSSEKPGFFRKVGRLLSSILKFLVMSTLLIVFCGFLLSLFDEELYLSVRRKITEVIQKNVPKYYLKRWDNGMLVAQRAINDASNRMITLSVDLFHRSQDYIAAFNSNEVVQQYIESIKSGWHILWIWMSETYASLSVELPRYFSSVKRIIFDSSSNNS